MRGVTRLVAPTALILLILMIWEMSCRLLAVPAYFLPPPSLILQAGLADIPALAAAAGRTLVMALSALVFASAVGTSLALGLALSPVMERAFKPVAVGFQVTPIIAIAPLAVIWAGLDHPGRAIVGLAAIVAFFPIFSGALTGLKSADPDLERLFDLYGAGRFQRLRRLRLPASTPFLLEGHKVAAGQALIGAVVAEFVARTGSSQGLAWIILESGQRLETARLFASLILLGIMGAVLYAWLQAIETAVLRRWRGR